MNMNLLETWQRAAKIKMFILSFLYNSFQNAAQMLPMFSDWLRRLHPNLPNSAVAYKRYFLRNMASENSREALGVRHAFSYVNIDRVRGFEPKKRFWNLIQVCYYKIVYYCVLKNVNINKVHWKKFIVNTDNFLVILAKQFGCLRYS